MDRKAGTEHSHGEETVDLGREAFSDQQSRRITEEYLATAVAEIESDDTQLEQARAVFPRRGCPSLSEPGIHSPRVEVRVPRALRYELAVYAQRVGCRESDVVCQALAEYLACH